MPTHSTRGSYIWGYAQLQSASRALHLDFKSALEIQADFCETAPFISQMTSLVHYFCNDPASARRVQARFVQTLPMTPAPILPGLDKSGVRELSHSNEETQPSNSTDPTVVQAAVKPRLAPQVQRRSLISIPTVHDEVMRQTNLVLEKLKANPESWTPLVEISVDTVRDHIRDTKLVEGLADDAIQKISSIVRDEKLLEHVLAGAIRHAMSSVLVDACVAVVGCGVILRCVNSASLPGLAANAILLGVYIQVLQIAKPFILRCRRLE